MAQEEDLVTYPEGIHASEEYIDNLFTLYWPDSVVPLSIEKGLPKLLVEGTFFKDISRIRKAYHFWEEARVQDKELFRGFVGGGVISREQEDWESSLLIKVCASLQAIQDKGWRTLRQIILLLDQHGRLTQPWGVRMLKWVNDRIPSVQVPMGNVAPAA
jgi:hypothetical protein